MDKMLNTRCKYILCILFLIFIILFGLANKFSNKSYIMQKSLSGKKHIAYLIQNGQYNHRMGKYINLYYTQKDLAYTDMIVRALDVYYPMLTSDFNTDLLYQVDVILWPTRSDMASLLNMDEESVPMGAYYAGVLNILSPDLWIESTRESDIKDIFLEEGPVVHELCHFVLDKKLSGQYPLWFTEGVALYYEKKYINFEWRDDLKEASKKITLDELRNSFEFLNEEEAYRRSYEIIQTIVNENGEDALQNIISEMMYNNSFEKAYKKVIKKEPSF